MMLKIAPGAALLTAAEMRAAEVHAISGGASAMVLMERAAAAAALAIRHFSPLRSALILCGPGNNGGDGYAIAVLLRDAGIDVRVAAAAPPGGNAANVMAARWGGPVEALASAAAAPLLIDSLFGTGLTRPLEPDVQAVIDRLRGTARSVVAIDIASGINSDTGAALGNPLAADLTISFGAMKRGHVIGAGQMASGRVLIADIGVPADNCAVRLVSPPTRLPLPADTHKYRRGAVLVIEGDARRGGATQLTALAALRSGAGVVTLAGSGEQTPAAAIMRRSDEQGRAVLGDARLGAIAIGPGLADDQRGRDWLALALAGSVPVVVDAGALALFGGPQDVFGDSWAPLVITPHDGEFARLFGAIGRDRIGAAQAAASTSGAIVVLKGASTIIARPDGQVAVNSHAAPWLATAGSGDVLTGIIAGLIAQGMTGFDAACGGVWLHGDAGIRGGPGLIADDIPALLPMVLAAL